MTTTEETPGRVSPEQLAVRFNVHPKLIRQLVHDGTIPHIRLGPRTVRIDPDEAIAALKGDHSRD